MVKKITARHRRAAELVLRDKRSLASVGREFGVTARTVRRWIDAIYPRPPTQEMLDMRGYPIQISHEYGSAIPTNYHDLNSKERREVREQYIEYFNGQCLYCEEQLDDPPHQFVLDSEKEIDWSNFPGSKEGFLKHPVHLHHDRETGLTIAPLHALCNAHSWHFHELSQNAQRFMHMIERMSAEEREEFAARMRKKYE